MNVKPVPAEENETLEPARGAEASRVDEVYEKILLQIVRGELKGGEELKSTVIAQQLGVSRTPVVQALQRLTADGIVSQELNKRAIVRVGAENWLVEMHELRELLEPVAAAQAAVHIKDEDLARLEKLAEAAKPHSSPTWTESAQQLDFDIHLTIARSTSNFALGETIRKIWVYKRLSYLAAPEKPETLEKGYGEHMALLDALRTHDPKTAEIAMRFHLRSAATLRTTQTIV